MGRDDLIVLSKGHAAAALYTVLAKSGRMDESLLSTFYKDGTHLAAHPPCSGKIPAIPFGTGSLGHGLSLASGIVFSQKFTKRDFRVFCILSEGDCNEGSTWEAALFASQHRLSNLTVIVDANGLQGIGKSSKILDLEPLKGKWEAFGFDTVCSENGNDFENLRTAFSPVGSTKSKKPLCIIARTIKGHGISFMEDKVEWHYLPMSDSQYRDALTETEGRG
jgi:transketolase